MRSEGDVAVRRFFDGSGGRANLIGMTVGLALSLASTTSMAAEGHSSEPVIPEGSTKVEHSNDVFGSDPTYEDKPYSPEAQYEIYGAKKDAPTPRPAIEVGRPIYTDGPFEPGINVIGERNLLFPGLSVFGDWQTAIEYNDNGADERGQIATTLNLNVNLQLTGTERFFAFVRPLEKDGQVTRYEFFGDDADDEDENLNGNVDALFFEGDVASIMTGLTGEDQHYDLPIALGFMPVLFQNGIWVDETIIGGGTSIIAQNDPTLGISNMDLTFFYGGDNVENPNIVDQFGVREEHNLDVFGMGGFIEANEGYWEFGYGALRGEDGNEDQDFNSLTVAFSKRYGGWLSNSIRGFWLYGQDRVGNAAQTVDGGAILIENSLITHLPSTLIPYANFFIGFDKPAPLIDQTGLLKNTGITFDSDGLQGFPKLDDSANDTYGGAIGLQYLFNLDQQLVVEASTNQVIGGFDAARKAVNDQYAAGIRYQLPITPTWIMRADGIYGWLRDADDIRGARLEFRRKF
ncbi:MAG: hypothetical protein RIM72_03790 [Alphaproteobacteria bacterium]